MMRVRSIRRSPRWASRRVRRERDEVREQAQAVVAAPLGVELDAEQPTARRPRRRTAGRARSRRGRDRPRRRRRRRRTSGRSRSRPRRRRRRTPGAAAAARPGSSRCGGASARPSRRRVRPGRTPSVVAPSSSLPSNRSCRPRQIPRNGRSSAIQPRIGSTRPAASRRAIAGAGGTDARHDERIGARSGAPERWPGARAPRSCVSACSMLTRLPAS